MLIGVLCACNDYDEISDFIEERALEPKEMGFLILENGVPSSDTVRRIVEVVNHDQLYASLDYAREHIVSSLTGCHVIVVDGKTQGLCFKKQGMQRPLHL